MASKTITSILECAPNIRCFAIASDELVVRSSKQEARSLPRSKRQQAARRYAKRWKRAIETIMDRARETTYGDLLRQLRELPCDAVTLTFDSEAADNAIDLMAARIQSGPNSGIGICEEIVSEDVAFVWLWNDK